MHESAKRVFAKLMMFVHELLLEFYLTIYLN
jgi:hypothetical protein